MRADADAYKRRQNRNSFIRMTLEVKGGHDTLLVPLAAAKPMQLKTTCEGCNCRYSYIGAAIWLKEKSCQGTGEKRRRWIGVGDEQAISTQSFWPRLKVSEA